MERWLPIPEYEGLYSVSDQGRIRIEVRRHNIRAGAMLAQTPARDGYLCVALRHEDEWPRGRNFAVSRVVLMAFDRQPEEGEQANHKNGDITDNRLSNLEWTTVQENIRHSIEVLGSSREGEKNPAAKLTEEQVVEIRERIAAGANYAEISDAFGISRPMAGQIAKGRAWKNAGGPITPTRPRGRPRRS